MEEEIKENFFYALENSLDIELTEKKRQKYEEIFKKKKWSITNETKDLIFSSHDLDKQRIKLDSSLARKLYTGTVRKKNPILYLQDDKGKTKGAFSISILKDAWKFTYKDSIKDFFLIPYENNKNEAQYLQLEFSNFYMTIKSIKQLFPTDDLYATQVEDEIKYGNAYQRFKEIMPFMIDRIIDLLSTETIAYSYQEWIEDPFKYDIPNVDTANITLAKSIIEELPLDELKLFIKTIRSRISDIDWEEQYDGDTLDRHKKALNYAKKRRTILKKKKKEKRINS